jgi:ribonuclease Z
LGRLQKCRRPSFASDGVKTGYTGDVPVSFIVEWNGLELAYSSDTFPNKWWMEHTKNADVAIHECFAPPSILIQKQKFTPQTALNVGAKS